jgi:hypothetical protein
MEDLGVYCALTTLAHHHVMKNGDDMSAVIEGLRKDHALLAAFLTASDTWQALHRHPAIGGTPKPVEHQVLGTPKSPISPFAFRRANLEVTPSRASVEARPHKDTPFD